MQKETVWPPLRGPLPDEAVRQSPDKAGRVQPCEAEAGNRIMKQGTEDAWGTKGLLTL